MEQKSFGIDTKLSDDDIHNEDNKTLKNKLKSLDDKGPLKASFGNVPLPTDEELYWALTELNLKHETISRQIVENFHASDSDRSGSIDREELGDLLVSVSRLLAPDVDVPGKEDMEHAIDAAMEDLDEDGNGTLDLKEFSRLVKMYVILASNMGSSGRPLEPAEEQLLKRKQLETEKRRKAIEALDLKLKDLGLTRKLVNDHIRKSFNAWDKDGDGTISKEELGPLLVALMKSTAPDLPKPSPAELKVMVDNEMKELDQDGDGVLERAEFAVLVKRYLIHLNSSKKADASNGKKEIETRRKVS